MRPDLMEEAEIATLGKRYGSMISEAQKVRVERVAAALAAAEQRGREEEREAAAAFAHDKHDWPARWIAAALRGENDGYTNFLCCHPQEQAMRPDEYGEYDDFNEYDLPACPHCQGSGEVNCHCGGDLCVCENYGDAPCPVCFGEGEVTEARYDLYMENMRKQAEMIRAAVGSKP